MSLFDTIKKVAAGITSGGSSLLLSRENQAKLGGGILAGAGALLAGGAASGLAKGAQAGGGGMLSGAWSGLKTSAQQALSLGTAGSQKTGDLSQWAIDKLGLAGATSSMQAPAVAPGGYARMPGGAMVPTSMDSGFARDPYTGQAYTNGGAQVYPAMAGIGPAAGAMGRWAGTAVGGALGLRALKGLMTSAWGFVSRKNVVKMAKAVGIEATAVALGVGAVEVAQMVMAEASKPARRRRGITAADLRRTKSTIGKINRMSSQLACLNTATRGKTRRTRAC